MLRHLRFACWVLGRGLVSLRYRVRVEDTEQFRDLKGPILVLPNHPGYIDPLLVLTSLPRLHLRPLVFSGTFRNPVLYPFMKLLNAVEVPDLERPSAEARAQANAAVQALIESLKRGDNCIMWPSGRLQRDGVERLGGAQALTDILKAVPDCQVVLVRTRGVWGSMFSFAQTGKLPDLRKCQRRAIGTLLGNLLFFTPRRKVHMKVERLDRSKLPGLDRARLNPWFEKWYNLDSPEKPTYVPYHFLFGPREFDFPPYEGPGHVDPSLIKQATKTAVNEMLADKLGQPLNGEEVTADTTLDSLGLDSLGRMDIALQVERRFGFSSDQAPLNVGQLWALAEGLVEKAPPKPPPAEWSKPPVDTGPVEIKGETIAEAFVNRALVSRKDVAVADDLAGVVTYEKLLVGALLMARRFAKIPAANVGLLLPASVACDTALMGLYLAGKLPVLLNWTTGPANLASAVRTMGLTHVVASKQFLDRSGVSIEGVQFVNLEDVRQGISKWEMMRTLLTVRHAPGRIRKRLPRPDPDSPAVVLFTSGSEKAPKAVPLTHRNLISNQRAGISVLKLTRTDAVLGFLPAFHSFGCSVTGLLPLLGGLRNVHHADPTDARGLARKIAAYGPTVLATTPTFFNYILERSEPGQLDSLRLVITGAEKLPESVVARARERAPKACVLEGYGVTECSPVVASNRPEANRPGTIGLPVPGVEVCVVDLETNETQPRGKMGMLLVSGPCVFPGYQGFDGPQPFEERDGKRWYVTGDLAEIDADGFIHFRGRLKRFLKAGGEMISLPALEEPFAKLFPATKDGPRVAVEGIETGPGQRRIVLFSTEPYTLKEANALLAKEGFQGVMRLDEVQRLEAIPVLGTGKTDYKKLRELITAPPVPVG